MVAHEEAVDLFSGVRGPPTDHAHAPAGPGGDVPDGRDLAGGARDRDPGARLRFDLLEIQDAVDFAESSPLPAPEDALQDLFVHYPWRD